MRFFSHLNLTAQGWFLLCAMSLPIILMYIGFLDAPLVFDDYAFIYPAARQNTYWDALLNFKLRSIPYATFELTRQWFGQNLWGWHLGNVLLHILVCMSIFGFLQSLFKISFEQNPAVTSTKSTYLAFFGALLFGLHPIAVYAVAYLNQRSILMATLFTLLMWQLLVLGIKRNRSAYVWLSTACYFSAVLSKEHAIMAPAVSVVLYIYLYPLRSIKLIKVLPVFLMYALIGLFVVQQAKNLKVLGEAYQVESAIAFDKLGIADPSKQDVKPSTPQVSPLVASPITQQTTVPLDTKSEIQVPSSPQVIATPTESPFKFNLSYIYSVITEGYLFFKYLGLWLLPITAWMAIDIFYPFVTKLLSFPESLGCLAFICYPILAFSFLKHRGERGLLGLAMLCPWLLFFTEFAVIRVQESFVLYRSYLWMPGLFLALPWIFRKLTTKSTNVVLLSCALILVPLTWNRLKTFSDPILVWDDAAKLLNGQNLQNLPGVERVFYNRGVFLNKAHRESEAIIDFTKTIAIAKDQGYLAVNAYFNRGRIYFEQEQYQLAEQDFSKVITLEPSNSNAYILKGQALEKLNQAGAAESTFKENFLRNLPFK